MQSCFETKAKESRVPRWVRRVRCWFTGHTWDPVQQWWEHRDVCLHCAYAQNTVARDPWSVAYEWRRTVRRIRTRWLMLTWRVRQWNAPRGEDDCPF